jgi:hypothetical protein
MRALFHNLKDVRHPNSRVRRRSCLPAVEGLDQRALLSAGLGYGMTGQGAAALSHAHETEHNGTVVETPLFYEDYVGPRLAQLEAVSATGLLLRNGNFSFVGVNKGAINLNVRATYVFGIDRNGNLPTGPFPDRPNIRFDATVAIKIVPGSAPSVAVTDLAKKTTTTIQDPNLEISGKRVKVEISGTLLPSTGLTPSHYRFNFWPEDGLAGSTNIASFAPAASDIQVGVANRP